MRARQAACLVCAPAALGGLVAVSLGHKHELAQAAAGVEPWLLAAAVGLHALTLVARSEAWCACLGAIGGSAPARRHVHLANAGAFVVGSLQSHATVPARIVLLRRLDPERSPGAGPLLAADAPIVALEACIAAALVPLAAAALPGAPLWLSPLAIAGCLGLLLALRLTQRAAPGHSLATGLSVLACRRGRARLARLMTAVGVITLARIWLLLAAFGLQADPAHVALAFVSMSLLGLLPIGPAAGAGATVAAAGGHELAAAGAAGLALSASSIAGVALYAAAVLCASKSVRSGSRSPRSTSSSISTQSMSRAAARARA